MSALTSASEPSWALVTTSLKSRRPVVETVALIWATSVSDAPGTWITMSQLPCLRIESSLIARASRRFWRTWIVVSVRSGWGFGTWVVSSR